MVNSVASFLSSDVNKVKETGGEMGKWRGDELVGEGFKAYVGRSVNRELERLGDVSTIILQAKCT